MTYKIVHIEIPCEDLKKAKEFYEAVFKWKIDLDTGMTDYAFVLDTGKEDAGVAFYKTDMKGKGGITLYIEVENIPEMLEKIAENGGKVIQEKTEVEIGDGCYAIFEDNSGCVMGLWSGK
jgi:predicted enzyme related to lactoylglutathione lyase